MQTVLARTGSCGIFLPRLESSDNFSKNYLRKTIKAKMDTAKIFTDGQIQFVQLPKAYHLNGKEAFITQIGDTIVLLPKKEKWDSLFSSLDKFSDDFMTERKQPMLENRKIL